MCNTVPSETSFCFLSASNRLWRANIEADKKHPQKPLPSPRKEGRRSDSNAFVGAHQSIYSLHCKAMIITAKRWLTRSVGIFYGSRIDGWCRDSGSTSALEDRGSIQDRKGGDAGTKCPGTSRLGTYSGQRATVYGSSNREILFVVGKRSTWNGTTHRSFARIPTGNPVKESFAPATRGGLATGYRRMHLGEFGGID